MDTRQSPPAASERADDGHELKATLEHLAGLLGVSYQETCEAFTHGFLKVAALRALEMTAESEAEA